MSRIIVKNLPLKADEAQIRKHFSSKGDVTDVKILRKKDGSSRRFCFIGFKTNQQAADAAAYFNESYMGTSRLNVDLAKDMGDRSLVSERDIAKRKREHVAHDGGRIKKGRPEEPENSRLAEYLDVMKPQRSRSMWNNDDTGPSVRGAMDSPAEAPAESDGDINDMAEANGNDNDLGDEESMEGSEQDESSGDAGDNVDEDDAARDHEIRDPNMSDLEWLRSRRTRIKENGDKPEVEKESTMKPAPAPTLETQREVLSAEEQLISETGRLFLRNLSYTATDQDLRDLFSKFGEVKEAHVSIDPRTDKSKGFAFVLFAFPENAIEAYNELDGTSFQGRLLHVIAGKTNSEYKLDEFDLKNLPLKKQNQLKRKATASKGHFSWNSLYLNQDAVLETMASKMGVTKAELLDPHSSNTAVKQALAESSVLQSVQHYFKSKGIDLSKFMGKETTDKVILVKNIPYNTSIEEISDMFAQYGDVVRTLMPPEGGLAIVEFKTAQAGRSAFSKLAFRRVGNSILYLQKAPVGVLESAPNSADSSEATESQEKIVVAKSGKEILGVDSTQETQPSSVHTSLFVKNLNFATTVDALTRLFKPLSGFVSAQIKTKPSPADPAKTLSMGYGFVEFASLDQAQTAMTALQGHALDGHQLQLKISNRGEDKAVEKSKRGASSKIIIKNIPFETNKKDIMELFGTFGQLRSVRLPKKLNKQTRGFAFAEFATPKEAEHAMTSLQGAHILGRRLVMEYAEADAEDAQQEIARMEAKVKSQVAAEDLANMRLNGQRKGFDLEPEDA